jgi:SAM-dependent methyltransferase
LRPLTLDGKPAFQLTLTGGHAAEITNHGRHAAREQFLLLLSDATEAHVAATTVDLHVRVTRKGHVLLSRSKPLLREQTATSHDRGKDYPLTRIEAGPLLRALGFADARDNLLPSMQAKFRQVNEFLRIVDATLAKTATSAPLRIVDAGCGKAYLSLAAQAYLAQTHGREVHLTGVDLREDVVRTCLETAERLGLTATQAHFEVADIATFQPAVAPDLVMSLHACDTASDEAIARGIEWGAGTILCAPCCQHEIQRSLPSDGPQRALLRHGILKERLADLLADAFRAQLLRILGYRVRVVEFVEPDATARNVMIRAERGVRPGMPDVVAEYLELRTAWRVVPYLETRLASLLAPHVPDLH